MERGGGRHKGVGKSYSQEGNINKRNIDSRWNIDMKRCGEEGRKEGKQAE